MDFKVSNRMRVAILGILFLFPFVFSWVREMTAEYWLISAIFAMIYLEVVFRWTLNAHGSSKTFYRDISPLLWPFAAFLPWKCDGSNRPNYAIYLKLGAIVGSWLVILLLFWTIDNHTATAQWLLDSNWELIFWILEGVMTLFILFWIAKRLRRSWCVYKIELSSARNSAEKQAQTIRNLEACVKQVQAELAKMKRQNANLEGTVGPYVARAIELLSISKNTTADALLAEVREMMEQVLHPALVGDCTLRNSQRHEALTQLLKEGKVAVVKTGKKATIPRPDDPFHTT